ncbi:UDP-N-acetylmuramoyl-L-alanyl-D-glutamate--2,6-diaminopimelate ligase [Futiania mangrovi]|uniref:UDP-N-acetylmuramoyl-L-alanyl-D-glutamate--2,6-diaminopimelate ligase n=1 Tax=Futiania mangrovi TaxID=2959716 RepID=A0A9J6P7P9_9PROT|nr:UDP-N-acetylmuramoyl-L-alanyl-D-glutamate--2,6-diaminopimelate ligase [Futiania mangrovii]MCP1334948.1 UDP-N-acetylmuramoyl-L-alanyl-D-glutamate--2,6-diaminopimelate ligase [Futiania mangrovii]
MKLDALITADLPPARGTDATASARDVEICGLTADSREVRPGYLFAALPGTRTDGARFAQEAVARGAIAILAPEETAAAMRFEGVHVIGAKNPRRAFARMAAAWHGRQPDIAVAVTGTNGKSSVVEFTRQVWAALGREAAALGTLGVVTGRGVEATTHTTPDPVALHALLADLKDRGIERVAFEASSHGLSQYRTDGVRLTAAAFTNLTRDHQDYHPTHEDYLLAKLRLFGEVLGPGGTAVLNADDAHFTDFEDVCWARGLKVLTYGAGGRDLVLEDADPHGEGQAVTVRAFGVRRHLDLALSGRFQAMNALAAAGLAIASGEDADAVFAVLPALKPVPGRMERVGTTPSGAAVYVDYAHTPDALETVLTALRPHAHGALHVVFGCGGDRDRGKRPLMGEVAARLADRAVVTDDNPRSEDPAAIRAEILAAAPGAIDGGERRAAICEAVAALGPGDLLLIAGKGHETGQTIGAQVIAFDDRDVAREAIAAQGGKGAA